MLRGMNMQIALHHLSRQARPSGRLDRRLLRPLGTVLALALSLGLLWSSLPPAADDDGGPDVAVGQLVRWRDARHDWLVVVDPDSHELVVYDAHDGRPLERFGTDDGLPPVQSIRNEGPLVTVSGAGRQTRLLKLPELELVSR